MQENKRRRGIVVLVFFAISLVAICGLTFTLIRSAINGTRSEPEAVLAGVRVETLAELPNDKAYPEALTIGPDGHIYVASFCTGTIWKITPTGDLSTWYHGDELKAASGLAFAPDGSLYVADRGSCNPRQSKSSIKHISADASSIETVGNLDENDIPNSLTFDKNGVLYLTDTQHGTIRYLSVAGIFETWWNLPRTNDETAQPTGLAYDASTDTLIVADTRAGAIYRVGFDEGRQADMSISLFEEGNRALDGLTVDPTGRIFITLFNKNEIALLNVGGSLSVLARDFREPSDIAYLDGVLYVTNFDSVSLAPIISIIADPSLPFTVDAVTLPDNLGAVSN